MALTSWALRIQHYMNVVCVCVYVNCDYSCLSLVKPENKQIKPREKKVDLHWDPLLPPCFSLSQKNIMHLHKQFPTLKCTVGATPLKLFPFVRSTSHPAYIVLLRPLNCLFKVPHMSLRANPYGLLGRCNSMRCSSARDASRTAPVYSFNE